MKMFAYHFRKLAAGERIGRRCRMATPGEKRGTLRICGRPAVIAFTGLRAVWRGQEKAERIEYCQTHGETVARLYGARVEAPDEAPCNVIPSEAPR